MNLEDQLKNIFKEIFGLPTRKFRDELTPETVKEWDSISHLVLFHALEKEFKIKLESDEIVNLTSVKKIKELLRLKGVG